jgi:hypothetical protein
MWERYPWDPKWKQFQHERDFGEIQDLLEKKISNEHSFV